MYVAIRDAFKAMRRQLQDLRMLPAPRCEDQRGTRESADCFRRKAMASSKPWMAARFTFTKTACSTRPSSISTSGDEVILWEEAGDKGPQANTIRLAGKH